MPKQVAPVYINDATKEELDTLYGIDGVKAQRILDYRTKHGRFRTVKALAEVEGISGASVALMFEHAGEHSLLGKHVYAKPVAYTAEADRVYINRLKLGNGD